VWGKSPAIASGCQQFTNQHEKGQHARASRLSNRAPFTLIELLVVIAIPLVLTSPLSGKLFV